MTSIRLAQRLLAVVVGLPMAANGTAMLLAGAAWYAAVPGVTETGPFNPHFVKDIGAAYLVAGLALTWFAGRASALARGAALGGAVFLGLHGLIHLAEAAGDPDGAGHLARDFAGVLLPPILALTAIWPGLFSKETADA
ncbi:MAG TPA: hypothetical protein VKQ54_07860 [Caulobacteraceae bacterium]|nr:hypothetical protein [Caulobacteraceae bacterium]